MTTNPSVKTRPSPWDALVVAFVAILALAVAVAFYGGREDDALTAVVTHRGDVVARVPLTAQNKTIPIDGEYHLAICVDGGKVWISQSDCPGQDCVRTGSISKAGQSIVCLPEQVVVSLESGGSADVDLVLG